jgi:hypothetical protein
VRASIRDESRRGIDGAQVGPNRSARTGDVAREDLGLDQAG